MAKLLHAVAILAVMVVSFGGALLASTGGVHAIGASSHALDAGGFRFTYGAGWQEVEKSELPGTTPGAIGGSVVAGLCSGTGPDCAKGVDVTYLQFEEGASFPRLETLQLKFDRGFPRSFENFRRVSSKIAVTGDGTPYLRYEFEFTKGGQKRREIIGAYRMRGDGVIAVATGPVKHFQGHRKGVLSILDGAMEIPAEGHH